jgi:hypothetical protein
MLKFFTHLPRPPQNVYETTFQQTLSSSSKSFTSCLPPSNSLINDFFEINWNLNKSHFSFISGLTLCSRTSLVLQNLFFFLMILFKSQFIKRKKYKYKIKEGKKKEEGFN